MSARRQHRCDACGATRLSWQRLCTPCWHAIPGDIRTGLTDAFKQGRLKDWRAFRRRAREARAALPARAIVPPERAYALSQRLLGERE